MRARVIVRTHVKSAREGHKTSIRIHFRRGKSQLPPRALGLASSVSKAIPWRRILVNTGALIVGPPPRARTWRPRRAPAAGARPCATPIDGRLFLAHAESADPGPRRRAPAGPIQGARPVPLNSR
ncbi:hypothetical protein EVAR_18656_1 [Eumeta japonica]|uniref:Uncharacterized protein n=1 Tax=Eumeta variegata TaxID=151549 RepID=A0A4C1U6M6_EUMVA|nr:hypothetical protein EVAR_18656_1 [Eumeta japonica]